MTKKHLLAISFISIAVFLAYANSLNGTWALDDIVAGKPVAFKDLHDFIGFRKVAYLSFALNQFIAPFSPVNFRLLNILIHILNSAMIYILAYKSMLLYAENHQQGVRKQREKPDTTLHDKAFHAAFFSSVLFALHPININAVAYIVQRMASLATFFVLLALLSYIGATKASDRRKAFLLYGVSGVLVIGGIFSKENAVMAIPLILLYDCVFLSHCEWQLFRKRMLLVCGIGILSVGLSFGLLKMHTAVFDVVNQFLSPEQPLTGKAWTAVDVYWTPLQHLLTEFRVISRYLFLLVAPVPNLLVFDWWGFPVSKGLADPLTTAFSFIGILSLFVVSVWKLKRYPMLCFGILWYFCAISLESFIAIGSDLYFEHRNYLPVAGLFMGVAAQMAISLWKKVDRKIMLSVILIIGTTLGVLTFSRNFVWKDSLTLWGDTVSKAPSNVRAILALGNAHLQLSEFQDAERYSREVIRISVRDERLSFLDDAAYSLGMLLLFSGKMGEAADLIKRYELTVESYRPQILKGFYKASANDFDGALEAYQKVVDQTKARDSVVVNTLMGDAYRKKGLADNALKHYAKALSLDPWFSAAYYGMGLVYMSRQDVNRAQEYFQKALTIDPDNILALSDMADVILIRKGPPDEALRYALKAVSKSPPFYQPYLSMGSVLIVLGRETEAAEFYRKAAGHNVPAYMVPLSKARAYYLRGDTEKAKSQIAELSRFKNLPEQIRDMISQGQM
jgi:tetratricopeptide (TPR) repeat protein